MEAVKNGFPITKKDIVVLILTFRVSGGCSFCGN